MDKTKEILKKYTKEFMEKIQTYEAPLSDAFSKEYQTFRNEALTRTISSYEKIARSVYNIIQVKPKKDDEEELRKAIEIAHLNLSPAMATSFAAFTAIIFVVFALFIGLVMFLFSGGLNMSIMFLSLLIMLTGFLLVKPVSKIPLQISGKWRLKAGNQMVLCILYIVMYMRHTSNLEHAIKFAAEHIGNPLALDLRKVFWDVETGRYATIKESLNSYLIQWKDYNSEFVESIHLIESSLYEPVEKKRVERLEKALEVMLEGTYERMMHFAQELKNPITMLHMLGIILPILGLIILPLMGTFLGIKWWHLGIFYNIVLPTAVYLMGMNILGKRPIGYGTDDDIINDARYEQYKYPEVFGVKIDPILPAFFIGFVLCLLGLLPLILYSVNVQDFEVAGLGSFLDFRDAGDDKIGPFGVGATLAGLLLPLGIALSVGIYYKLKTKELIKIRNETKILEKEFSGSLFQFGSRVEDGIPVEAAFSEIAANMRGTRTGQFFQIVNMNLRQLGMSVKEAIYNEERGALKYFPSSLINSSMKVLVESARKGPLVVARSLISISLYVNKIRAVNERLKDLLADITSSMKGQISFLTPMIAGVVVGIGTMITTIIGRLGQQLGTINVGDAEVPFEAQNLLGIFPPDKIIPPYYFQLVVGVYVIEIIIILTILSNAIENGIDKLNEKNQTGKNLYRSMITYFIIAFSVTIIFNLLAIKVSQGLVGV